MRPALAYYLSYQDPVARWANNCSRNGGPVSATRVSAVRRFWESSKRIGTDRYFDEMWFLWGESANQALVSFKLGLVGVPVSSPTFTANEGYAGDALSAYVRLGFIPSVHGRAMSPARGRIEAYVRNNVSGTMDALGVAAGSTIRIRPRTTTDFISAGVFCAVAATTSSITDSRGLAGAELNGASPLNYDKNGTELASTVVTPAMTLPTSEFYLLANNNSGTAQTFSSHQVGYAAVGAPLVNAAMKAAHYANVQQLATDIGANV